MVASDAEAAAAATAGPSDSAAGDGDDELQAPYASLMIVTAALVAFGHGSNDIANSVGPFSVVLEWAQTGTVAAPAWVQRRGAAGVRD